MGNARTYTITAAIAVLALTTACQPTSTTGAGTTTTGAATADGNKDGAPKAVPNFVGMGLQSAQDAAQKAGFYGLDSHDALGRARNQILDRDWKVCSQNIAAGKKVPTNTGLDFGAVKLKEDCPQKDQAAPSAAGGTMPDFRGKSVKAARGALDSSTSITVEDAAGSDRMVLIESNWKVCSQAPGAGGVLKGQPVTFKAVKFGESCP